MIRFQLFADHGKSDMQAEQAAFLPGGAAEQRMAGGESLPAIAVCSAPQSMQSRTSLITAVDLGSCRMQAEQAVKIL